MVAVLAISNTEFSLGLLFSHSSSSLASHTGGLKAGGSGLLLKLVLT